MNRYSTFVLYAGIVYTLGLLLLLITHFTINQDPQARATILMGLGLFVLWVLIGGTLQKKFASPVGSFFSKQKQRPLTAFMIGALGLVFIEEAIATLMTNLGPVLGDQTGTAHITASTHYVDVILFHSVIVFIPMLFTLGFIAKHFNLSPFSVAVLWGTTGLVGEFTLAGAQVFINAPFWFLVYGLMVYLPAHSFIQTQRKPISVFLLPCFLLGILLSAVTTAWIPFALNHETIHFPTEETAISN